MSVSFFSLSLSLKIDAQLDILLYSATSKKWLQVFAP